MNLQEMTSEELLKKLLWRCPIITLDHDAHAELLKRLASASSLRETPRPQLWDEARTKKLVDAVWKADTQQNNFDDSTHADYCVRAVIEQMIELERAASLAPPSQPSNIRPKITLDKPTGDEVG
jgi:hypothetical protein